MICKKYGRYHANLAQHLHDKEQVFSCMICKRLQYILQDALALSLACLPCKTS